MIKELTISGFRGFGITQTIRFALPNETTLGSGLTIITGANNSGKTTIVESIRAFNGSDSPSFSEGRRNARTNGVVELTLTDENEQVCSIASIPGGGSSTKKEGQLKFKSYIIPSRRVVPYDFGRTAWDRNMYISNAQKMESQRSASLSNFDARIFQIEQHKLDFDRILTRVLGYDFQWTVEMKDSGSYYIKYNQNGITHSSEGVGDGIWSIFTICAALFDAPDKSVIIIDEPELSIHPAIQRRLLLLLLDYSKKHQIILSTHSSYFISWEAIANGAQLIRVVKEGTNSICYSISEDSRQNFKGFINDLNNPHTLGLEANEAFFLEDSIILVEGQEDVVIYNKIAKELGMDFKGSFFGWGVGGAAKMRAFLMLFRNLGYKHVVTILDGDKAEEAETLKNDFSEYKIITLAKDDIRDKKERSIQAKEGITDDKGKLKKINESYAITLINEINSSL